MFQVEAAIEYICRNEGSGAILVFLTGWDEISKLLDKLKGNNLLGDPHKFLILPLHGSMPTVNQCEIFDRPPLNKRQACFFCQFHCISFFILEISLEKFMGRKLTWSIDKWDKDQARRQPTYWTWMGDLVNADW